MAVNRLALRRVTAAGGLASAWLPAGAHAQVELAQVISTDPVWGSAFLAVLVYLPMALAVIHITLMLWLWPDARARGLERPIGWLVALFFLGPLALLFYLGMRPPGRLKQCDRCGEDCLATETVCPHCGYSVLEALEHPLLHDPPEDHRRGAVPFEV